MQLVDIDLSAPDSEYTSPTPVPIWSVSLQAADGIAISSDSDGVKTWDILTGLCMASFRTPVEENDWRDAQLIGGRTTCVWPDGDKKIHIWDTEGGEHQIPDVQSLPDLRDLRISGDRSKIFLLDKKSIQVLSIWTGEIVAEAKLEGEPLADSLVMDGLRVWFFLKDLQIQGWEFGISDSTPVPLSNTSPHKPNFCFLGIMAQNISPSRVDDTVTRKEIFQLFGRYAKPSVTQWDG